MVIAAAGVAAAGSIAGATISSSAAGSAAGAAQQATNYSTQAQEAEYNQTLRNEQPYLNAGQNALARTDGLIDGFNSTIQPYQQALAAAVPQGMTEANLVNTPGYQFNLSQGLQATQNAAAARGLGVSGAALKGAATYATGLADSTYQNQFNNQQTQYSDASNNLTNALNVNNQLWNQNNSLATLGGNVAVQQGTTNQGFANAQSNLLTGNANAQGAASIASGNALSSGVSGVSNALSGYNQNQLLQQYLGNSGSQYGSDWSSSAQSAPASGWN